jgi:hypothetical protein
MGRRVACRIVDLHELKLWPAPGGAQRQATDPTETIDANFDVMGVLFVDSTPPTAACGISVVGWLASLPASLKWMSGR